MNYSNDAVNEAKLSVMGKLFLATLGAWLVGKQTNVKFRGTEAQVQAIANAMLASKRFQEELSRPGATVETVMQKLGLKQLTAREFERQLGVQWPL